MMRLNQPCTHAVVIDLPVKGSGVAAPGVIYECGVFHMFIQTEFMKYGGVASTLSPALLSVPDSDEDGIYIHTQRS
ncbi:hypothetical protein [Candidatus Phyllobacterium onerii]|uniref:hypothetical protein n=1 Tax=Candidatus Phyllobacterium onerii TaxID=3020828 RepID=UPI00232C02DD|nr:hypothetical protein [Phyllobacterium sp. IY22]